MTGEMIKSIEDWLMRGAPENRKELVVEIKELRNRRIFGELINLFIAAIIQNRFEVILASMMIECWKAGFSYAETRSLEQIVGLKKESE